MLTRILALAAMLTIAFAQFADGGLAEVRRHPGVGTPRSDASFNVKWIHGCSDCSTCSDPPIQVYRFDSDTYIFRESKCLDFEGPFLYLLIGRKRALLLDSGAPPVKGQTLPIRETVERVLSEWEASHHRHGVDLIVAHSHGHHDHTYGDAQFEGQPHTVVVKPDVESVKAFFKLADWPEGSSTLDLGGRVLTIMPAPGHQSAHLAIYDANTGILLTGDMLYPGLLTVDNWQQYRDSVRRLSAFASSHRISYILGAHIEMTASPKEMYPMGSTFQPNEHVLQMGISDLMDLQKACDSLGDNPVRDVHDNFIILPLKH
jgi:hydroxyacylglutathione hydrolase